MSTSTDRAESIHSIQELFHQKLNKFMRLYDAAEEAAKACSKDIDNATIDLDSLFIIETELQEALSALQEALKGIGDQQTEVEQDIEAIAGELAALEAKRDEAMKTSFFQPGCSHEVAKAQFDAHYEQNIAPIADKVAQMTKDLQFRRSLKAQRDNEKAQCEADIIAKQTELAAHRDAIHAQENKISSLKAQFQVKLAQMRSHAN